MTTNDTLLPHPSVAEIEARYLAQRQAVDEDRAAAIARQNAATAHAIAYSFGEHAAKYERLVHLGSEADQGVAQDILGYCQEQAERYRSMEVDYAAKALRRAD